MCNKVIFFVAVYKIFLNLFSPEAFFQSILLKYSCSLQPCGVRDNLHMKKKDNLKSLLKSLSHFKSFFSNT